MLALSHVRIKQGIHMIWSNMKLTLTKDRLAGLNVHGCAVGVRGLTRCERRVLIFTTLRIGGVRVCLPGMSAHDVVQSGRLNSYSQYPYGFIAAKIVMWVRSNQAWSLANTKNNSFSLPL